VTQTPRPPAARQEFIREELAASALVKTKIYDACAPAITRSIDIIIDAFRAQKKVLLCGNGGSAADCQHLATELVIRMNPAIKRPALPAIALTTDASMLTAGANDIGYDNVFARSVEALGASGDVLLCISTSGRSESVNNAVRMAKSKGMTVIAFLGRDGGITKDLVDVPLIIPSHDTQRIQEGHITVGHIICALVEREMFT
jgi:D-sedoheptulose 7-phosphate isomerase